MFVTGARLRGINGGYDPVHLKREALMARTCTRINEATDDGEAEDAGCFQLTRSDVSWKHCGNIF
jgi:hypothetical protein